MVSESMQKVSRTARNAYEATVRRAEAAERRAEAAESRATAAERRAEDAERRLREGGSLSSNAKDDPTYRSTMHSFTKRLDAVEKRLLTIEASKTTDPESVPSNEAGADLLYGMPSIAAYLGIKVGQAGHLAAKGSLPTFKLVGNKNVCARRSILNAWLASQEGR